MRHFLVTALFLACTAAHADVYRCKDASGKVTFSDRACDGTSAPMMRTPSQPSVSSGRTDTDRLDDVIRGKLATGDIGGAKALAVTGQHWQWIGAAERGQTPRMPDTATSGYAPAPAASGYDPMKNMRELKRSSERDAVNRAINDANIRGKSKSVACLAGARAEMDGNGPTGACPPTVIINNPPRLPPDWDGRR